MGNASQHTTERAQTMNVNPAHEWMNLTVARSYERGKSLDSSGDMKKKKTRFVFVRVNEKREQRKEGVRK